MNLNFPRSGLQPAINNFVPGSVGPLGMAKRSKNCEGNVLVQSTLLTFANHFYVSRIAFIQGGPKTFDKLPVPKAESKD